MNQFIKNNFKFILFLIVYILLGVILLKFYQYSVGNDELSHIIIAQNYLQGAFNNAINGCFSPLFAWLLVPFLYIGITPILAAKLLGFLVGIPTLIGIKLLSYKLEMSEKIRNVILFASIPIVLSFAFGSTTSDLLAVCVLVFYFNVVFDSKYPQKIYYGIISGILGAIGYFAKSIVFPFFLAHFLFISVICYFNNQKAEKKKNIVLSFLGGMLVFSLLSGFWIGLISKKYHKLTISTVGSYIFSLKGGEEKEHPYNYLGFIAPPNENAVSIWEDPPLQQMQQWSPLQSWKDFKYEINLIILNSYKLILVLETFSTFSIGIIFIALLMIIQPSWEQTANHNLFHFLAVMAIFSGGLILINIKKRYLWIDYVLLLLIGGYILNVFFKEDFFNSNVRKNVAFIIFVLSFTIIPIKNIVADANSREDVYLLSEQVKNCEIKGNIASDINWNVANIIAFYTKNKYFGIAKQNISSEELEEEFKKFNIDYYFVWNENNFSNMYNYEEITQGKISGLKIYFVGNK